MIADLASTATLLLELPPQDRLLLGETLIESVHDFVDDEITEAWRTEIERRITEWKSGAVQTIPADEVFAKAAAMLSPKAQ